MKGMQVCVLLTFDRPPTSSCVVLRDWAWVRGVDWVCWGCRLLAAFASLGRFVRARVCGLSGYCQTDPPPSVRRIPTT